MEYLDVLDEHGSITGIIKDKNDIYNDGDWHRSVHIWIVNNNNEVLVQKRHARKETFPNLWAISVAGHVRSGESSVEAAIREIKEEINITINKEDLIYLYTSKRTQKYKKGHINVIDDTYLLKFNVAIENSKLQRSELSSIKYIHYKKLQEYFRNNDPLFVPQSEEQMRFFEILPQFLN